MEPLGYVPGQWATCRSPSLEGTIPVHLAALTSGIFMCGAEWGEWFKQRSLESRTGAWTCSGRVCSAQLKKKKMDSPSICWIWQLGEAGCPTAHPSGWLFLPGVELGNPVHITVLHGSSPEHSTALPPDRRPLTSSGDAFLHGVAYMSYCT